MSKCKKKPFHPVCSLSDVETYLSQLSMIDTISKKMNKLYQMSALSKHDVDSRQSILKFVQRVFQRYFPECSLVTFGSSINGFGIKGCDLDMMFLPFPDYEYLDASKISVDENIPTIKDAKANPAVVEQLKYMSKDKQLRFLLRVLRYYRREVKDSVYISAKCPILRFFISHEYYNLWCDLSFHHGLAKFNSELLRIFSIFDSRVKPLVITLRFWGKQLQLCRNGAFSSYAFTLLVIFFLQNIEEPLLPPVNDLMINAESCVVEGWEVGFVSAVGQDFVSRNTLSEEKLLKEFFRFYWNFDFARNVVCIRTGKVTPLSDIKKDADERMKNFMVTDVCVQDPFILSHNLTSSINLNRINLLKPYFFVANLIISKQLQSPECEDAFQLLFKREFYESKIKEHFFFHMTKISDGLHVYPNFEIISTIGVDFEKIWYERVCHSIRDILEYILFIDCEVIDKNYSFENIGFDDGYSESNQEHCKLLVSIQCTVDNKMWQFRNVKSAIPSDSYTQNFTNEVLKEENALSHFLLTSRPFLQLSAPVFWFLCNCYQSRYSQIPYVWINLIPLSPFSEFRNLCKAIQVMITRIVNQMIKNQCF